MKEKLKTITVYAGSADDLAETYTRSAYHLGKAIAQQKRTLVFGSGKTGLMGAVARGALDHSGEVVGVINDDLNLPNLVFDKLTRIETVPNIQIRQARMNQLGDAFIALPGGFGTFYEVLEALTWAQIGHHHKPIGFLNVDGYYSPLLNLIDHAIANGFIYQEHRGLFVSSDDPEELLAELDMFKPPENMFRWLVRE